MGCFWTRGTKLAGGSSLSQARGQVLHERNSGAGLRAPGSLVHQMSCEKCICFQSMTQGLGHGWHGRLGWKQSRFREALPLFHARLSGFIKKREREREKEMDTSTELGPGDCELSTLAA